MLILEKESTNLKYKKLWLLVGLCMVAFIVYSSLTSNPVTLDVKFSDKFMHVLGYFGLMGWFIQIYQQKKNRFILAAMFIAMGVSLEFMQDFGGVRYFEVNDMFANTAGVLLAWALAVTPFPKLLVWFESMLLR